MKLVVDIQAAQTSGSKNRGIGRYSLALAQAMARQAGINEIWIAANAAFADTIEPLRQEFASLIPREQFITWQIPTPVREIDTSNSWRRNSSEFLREAHLKSLNADFVHVSSLFEGLGDNAVTSVGSFTESCNTAVTLYDLIPLVNSDSYLSDRVVEQWYLRKLASLRRARLWLAISEHSRQEAIEWLGLPTGRIATIYPAADEMFRPIRLPVDEIRAILHRYGLERPFVMYTGGIDRRKNIESLITSYASLPVEVRRLHQLAIVCAAPKEAMNALKNHGKQKGLGADELVLTGFVSDDHLVALYNLCKAFCFPSWQEGFGLPALEAMQCGAATIGSNTSSIPEVIGCRDALFNPFSEIDIALRLKEVLTNDDFRNKLVAHGLGQAKKFNWDESAKCAWQTFQSLCEQDVRSSAPLFVRTRRRTLAYVSPLPPEKSGIADYSAEILPELARHYEIDAIVDRSEVTDKEVIANCRIRDIQWFEQNGHRYDRIIYHFGNSAFHKHMFGLLARYPGVVVLHDFYLSGVLAHMEIVGAEPIWTEALYCSHGFAALHDRAQVGRTGAIDRNPIVYKYPANFSVIRDAQGIIVHSEYSRGLGQRFYSAETVRDWSVVPLARKLPPPRSFANTSRATLGFDSNSFIVCSFGMLAPTKLNERLVRGWTRSILSANKNCYLVFVGEEHGGSYGQELRDLIQASPARERIRITGFASLDLYQSYLSAADVAVQLRAFSRGETSRSITDCFAYGIPTIANAHGSVAELPPEAVLMLPDAFSDAELSNALEDLFSNETRRKLLGETARKYVKDELSPRLIADRYMEAIEYFSQESGASLKRQIVTELAESDTQLQSEQDWLALSRAIARSIPGSRPQRQILIDISSVLANKNGSLGHRPEVSEILALLANPPQGYRMEPIYLCEEGGKWHYRYARNYACELLELDLSPLSDQPIEIFRGDVFYGLSYTQCGIIRAFKEKLFEDFRNLDIPLGFYVCQAATDDREFLSCLMDIADRIICSSAKCASQMSDWCKANNVPHSERLDIVAGDTPANRLSEILDRSKKPTDSVPRTF